MKHVLQEREVIHSIDTIQYMIDLCPDCTIRRDNRGYLPIHWAAWSGNVKAIELLLRHDPTAATRKSLPRPHYPSRLPLHLACDALSEMLGSAQVLSIQILYDAYPEAIFIQDERNGNDNGRTPLDIARKRGSKWQPIVQFLEAQHEYARQAKDMMSMMILELNGRTLLHRTMKDNAPLGSIKLLARGAPAAILGHLDENKDSILHYACRGGLPIVKYFLDEHISLVSSAEVNCNCELPIHLLCEAAKDKVDSNSNSTEYIEIVWRMLLVNPETVMGA